MGSVFHHSALHASWWRAVLLIQLMVRPASVLLLDGVPQLLS